MHAYLRRPTGRALAVEDRRLPDMTRPAHRQSSRRIEPPGQNVGYGVSRFTPEKPRSQNGVRPREEPGERERTARGKHHGDGLAEVQNRLGERALASR